MNAAREQILPPRPLALRGGWWVGQLAAIVLLLAVTILAPLGAVVAAREPSLDEPIRPMDDLTRREYWLRRAVRGNEPIFFGVVGAVSAASALLVLRSVVRRFLRVRRIARRSDEIEAHLAGLEREANRYAPGNRSLESRVYQFLVGEEKIRHAAGAPTERPLFLDENHTRALALRSGHDVLIVHTDLGPFAFSPSEERAIRERIERLRDAA